jgi:hypothetical protein
MPGVGFIRPAGGGAGGGSVSVVVSDASPSIGDTITITGTASGFTPDTYLFFAYDDTTNELVFVAEQASNIFNWTIPSIDVGNYSIYVLGVENGTPDVTAFGTVDISVSSSFLLDTAEGTGANFAFAFFRLRSGYTGAAALIRRSSDNAQKAFYFDSNDVLSLSSEDGSGTTLGDWIGASDGYLVTGYSQDTAGVTFTASNAADQQRIIIGGALVDLNGVVAMVGDDDIYVLSTSFTVNSAFVVAKNDGLSRGGVVLGGNFQPDIGWGGTFSTVNGIYGLGNMTNIEDLNPHIASFFADTGIYVDGSNASLGAGSEMLATRVADVEHTASDFGIHGKIACIVTYPTDKTSDRAAIEAKINSNFTTSLLP